MKEFIMNLFVVFLYFAFVIGTSFTAVVYGGLEALAIMGCCCLALVIMCFFQDRN